MATIVIRDFDEDLKACLRVRAAQHGRSMEEEARSILHAALFATPKAGTTAESIAEIRALVEPFGGIELELPPR